MVRLVDLAGFLCVEAPQHVDVLRHGARSPQERARVMAERVEEDIVYTDKEVLPMS